MATARRSLLIPQAAGEIQRMLTDSRPVSRPPAADSDCQDQLPVRQTRQAAPSYDAYAARRGASPRARMLRALTRRNLA